MIRFLYLLKDRWDYVKWILQRLFRKSHMSDSDLWWLSGSLARKIRLALEDFYQMPRVGYPDDFDTKHDWDLVIRKMINAFAMIERDDFDEQMVYYDELREGLDLFSKYFLSLWD